MTPPPHSKRVQAWVYAIINPLIENVRREISLLDSRNLTWRFYSRRCDYIRPIFDYIENSQWPNYEDFVADQLNPGFKKRFDEHDLMVGVVESCANQFFDGLTHSSIFLKQVEKSLDEYQASVAPPHPGLDSLKGDLPKYIAEYLINRTELLPHHYLTHKFWEGYQGRFDLYADEFEPYQQRQSFQGLMSATRALHQVSTELLPNLENHRRVLCSRYDIPFAPTPIDQSHSADVFTV